MEQSETLPAINQSALKLYPDARLFAEGNNLDVCLERYAQYKSIKDALMARKIKIRELAATYGERPIAGWLSTWIIYLASIMDFEISEQQRRTTANMLIEELYMLNMAEITLFFKKLQKGDYGTFYNKFNVQTILIAAKQYRQQRGVILSKLPEKTQNTLIES